MSNGPSNDKLIANVYLFNPDGTINDDRDCWPTDCSVGLDNCQPGCDSSDPSRNNRNPYLDISSLNPGEYTVKIGAAPVDFGTNSQGEDINTDGHYFNGSVAPELINGPTHVRSNYMITFTFN
jgi:hypothetical protein